MPPKPRCGRKQPQHLHARSPSATEAGEYYDSDDDDEDYEEEGEAESDREVEMAPGRKQTKKGRGAARAAPAV